MTLETEQLDIALERIFKTTGNDANELERLWAHCDDVEAAKLRQAHEHLFKAYLLIDDLRKTLST